MCTHMCVYVCMYALGRLYLHLHADALVNALPAEAMQAMLHHRRLLHDAEANGAHELAVQCPHSDRSCVIRARISAGCGGARLAVEVIQCQALNLNVLLIARRRIPFVIIA